MKKFNLMAVVLAVLALSVNGWGACSVQTATVYDGINREGPGYRCKTGATYSGAVGFVEVPCVSGNMNACSVTGTGSDSKNILQSCSYLGSGYGVRVTYISCSTQYEADSVVCINQGNVWQGGTCKENHCKAADTTWLTMSIASCNGENNYAIVNTDSTCEHVGTCCDGLDSIPEGNSCKWRCDSLLTVCNGRTGQLLGGVLPDTVSSLSDTVIVNKCYYNCSHSPNADSSVYLVEGNIVLGGPNDSIPDGIKSQSTFNSVRTETGGVYVYDYLTPAASEYIDSIAAMKCVEHLWRCVINSKYVYWYDNQEVPAGCTNIVRVK